ncbi:hypothetical protein VNO77_03013 [Canavalia gladiata]|uniref:Uncharacterized protein n=1 Tax=Canavalia gladiata TaxID=3824 RepID=A0AAN9MU05_CANGL
MHVTPRAVFIAHIQTMQRWALLLQGLLLRPMLSGNRNSVHMDWNISTTVIVVPLSRIIFFKNVHIQFTEDLSAHNQCESTIRSTSPLWLYRTLGGIRYIRTFVGKSGRNEPQLLMRKDMNGLGKGQPTNATKKSKFSKQ